MVCNKKRKAVFIKRKWNHVVFSKEPILSFHPVAHIINITERLLNLLLFLVFHVNAGKTEFMFNLQRGDISSLNGRSLKLVDRLTFLESSVSSTKNNTNTRLAKVWTAIDWLSVIWKSGLHDKIKRIFFQAAVVSIRLYGCTTWTMTKRLEKKLDGNCIRMLRATLKNPGDHIPQKSSCTETYHPSRKPSKLDKQDIRDTDGDLRTSS